MRGNTVYKIFLKNKYNGPTGKDVFIKYVVQIVSFSSKKIPTSFFENSHETRGLNSSLVEKYARSALRPRLILLDPLRQTRVLTTSCFDFEKDLSPRFSTRPKRNRSFISTKMIYRTNGPRDTSASLLFVYDKKHVFRKQHFARKYG